MIYFSRTVNVNAGKMPESMEWSQRVVAYANENVGTSFRILQNVTGPLNQIHFVNTLPSLGALDEANNKFATDEGYAALAMEAMQKELFGHMEDHLYRTVP